MQSRLFPNGPHTLDSLEAKYPFIPWREPVFVAVSSSDDRGYACRVCIANRGLKSSEVADLPKTPEPVEEHIRTEHPPSGVQT